MIKYQKIIFVKITPRNILMNNGVSLETNENTNLPMFFNLI